MDGKDLRQFLETKARKHGIESLLPIEIEYLSRRIDYNTYLQRCYLEYCKTKSLPPPNNFRTDQGFSND
jgi:hypothetical protein